MSSGTTTEATKRIYVGNLAVNVTQEDLAQLFGLQTTPYLRSSCGCELATDDKTGKSKGFAFITVPEHVASALMNLNGIEFYGRQLVIEESKTKAEEEKKEKKDGEEKGATRGGRGGRGNRGRGRGNPRWRNNRRYNKFNLPKLEPDQTFSLIDGGVNLTNPKFHQNTDYVIARAVNAGVQKMVVTGLKLNGSKSACVMAQTRQNVIYAAVGIHPHFVKDDWNDRAAEQLEELCKGNEVVAIGECGLDFNREYSPRELQTKAFKKQVELAIKYKKALLVHDRDAHEAVMEVLNEQKQSDLPPVVIHCFTGDADQVKVYLEKGFYIGVNGYLCKDTYGAKLREMIKDGILPLDRIVIQSDAPYTMPNTPHNEIDPVSKSLLEFCFHCNEPCTLSVIVRCIAKQVSKEPRDVSEICTQNALKVFKFPRNSFYSRSTQSY
jgi:TatD DNase family protein